MLVLLAVPAFSIPKDGIPAKGKPFLTINDTLNLTNTTDVNTTINTSLNITTNTSVNVTLNLTDLNSSDNATIEDNSTLELNTSTPSNETSNATTNITINSSVNTTGNITINITVNSTDANATGNATTNMTETNTTLPVLDKGTVLPTSRTYIYHGIMLASIDQDDKKDYYVVDHLGSIRETIAEDKKPDAVSYYAYGENATEPRTGKTYGFAAQQEDQEAELSYVNARYYMAATGRFLAVDTASGDLSDPTSLNRYAYVTNNPLRLVDPTGNAGVDSNLLQIPETPQDRTAVAVNPLSKEDSERMIKEGKLTDAMHDMANRLYGTDVGAKMQDWECKIGAVPKGMYALTDPETKTITFTPAAANGDMRTLFVAMGHEIEHAVAGEAMENNIDSVFTATVKVYDLVVDGMIKGDAASTKIYNEVTATPGGWIEYYGIKKIDEKAKFSLGNEMRSVNTENLLLGGSVAANLLPYSGLADSAKTDPIVLNNAKRSFVNIVR